MSDKKVKFLVRGGIIALATTSILLIGLHTLASIAALDWNSWAFFDWLVNYKAGFVRRGLVGALIHRYGYGHEVVWVNCLVFVLGASIVALLATLALRISNFHPKAALLYTISPAGFFWMALSNQYYYRKEMLFYLSLLTIAHLYLYWKQTENRKIAGMVLALIAISFLILPLVHEAFLFFCLLYFYLITASIVGFYAPGKTTRSILRLLVIANLVIFAMLSWFKGNAEQSSIIWASLSSSAQAVADRDGISGGISAIGWSIFKGFSLSVRAILSGMGTYYLFALAVIYLVVGYIFSALSGLALVQAYRNQRLNITFAAVCLSFLPLFALGWDWGRWIVGIYIVSSTMVISGVFVEVDSYIAIVDRIVSERVLTIFFFLMLFAICLLTKIPECCIDGPGDSFYKNRFVSSIVHNLKDASKQSQ
ncbi:MAG: hypothetical protein P8164_11805 [Gammaproteobacteria bacterium]|jgi:hypothetical protein